MCLARPARDKNKGTEGRAWETLTLAGEREDQKTEHKESSFLFGGGGARGCSWQGGHMGCWGSSWVSCLQGKGSPFCVYYLDQSPGSISKQKFT